MMKNRPGIINSRKYDGSLHRSWECELISFDDEEIICRGVFEKTVEHRDLGLIHAGTISYERFWLSRWYNVFRFEEPDGTLRNHYFNISMPPTFDGSTVEFVDLDIDIVVWPDGRVFTLDLDEFEQNRQLLCYSSEIVGMVDKTLDEILAEPARYLS
ncbi:MAG: DUF402 domain-containing protein [Blastocatellia bacterium]|nr:DUF402 domain-containing protein [Blastocatellia bacterium]